VNFGRLALGAAVAWQRAALVRRAKALAILAAVCFVLAAIAIGFGTTAIYFLLAPKFGPPAAAGLIAAIALVLLGALLLSMVVTMFVFHSLKTAQDAYWMLPMMGFAQLAVFACYSIYFPELFPTRLRGTGVGFCYNTVRYLAAPGPIVFGYLATLMSFRSAAVAMSTIYLVGVVTLIWAPETFGKPLPEDD